jgi:general secretion pathway protein A
MYKNFFGLRENPFNINPDPRFLHRTPRIQEALDQLTYGVQSRKGLLLLTGEVGTGKTTLINHLLDWLRQRQTPTAFIFNSHLNVSHLFDFILNDFGISTDYRLVSNMLLELNQWLIKRFSAGSTPVLIVDEAQGLSFELLEEIRLLLNLETSSEKLLQIVLVGQPELEDKLKQPQMRQLRQRIALRCSTAPLTLDEARGYIVDRLRIAGATREPIFEFDAVEALHYYSRGIPRVMNLLGEHALINSYVEGLNPVPSQMVEEGARDFLMEEFRPLAAWRGSSMQLDSNLTVIHSEPPSDLARSFREQAASSSDPGGAHWPAAAIGFPEEELQSNTANTMIATAPNEEEEWAASEEDSNTSLSVLDLVPAPPGLGTPQVVSRLAPNPTASQSDCAAELVATMGRLLAAATLAPAPQRETSHVASEPSLALTSTPAVARPAPSILAAIWSGVWAEVFRSTRGTIAAAGLVLRQWKREFTRDWKVTVTAMNFPLMRKSLAHWLHQPISSKPMASSKN